MEYIDTILSGKEFNKIFKPTKKFYNLDNNPEYIADMYTISSTLFDPASGSGIEFIEDSNIGNLLDSFLFAREVIIPDDALVYILYDKFRANKLYLKESVPLKIINKDVYIHLVRNDGLNLRYITPSEQTDELCKIALNQNGFALQYVSKKNESMYKIAYEQNKESLKIIDEKEEFIKNIKFTSLQRSTSENNIFSKSIIRYSDHNNHKHITGEDFNKIFGIKTFIKFTSYETDAFLKDGENISSDGISFTYDYQLYTQVSGMTFFRKILAVPIDATIKMNGMEITSDKVVLSARYPIISLQQFVVDLLTDKHKIKYFNLLNPQPEHISEMIIDLAPGSLANVDVQNDNLCKLAISKNPSALALVKSQTEELCEHAITINPRTIQFFKNQTPYLCN